MEADNQEKACFPKASRFPAFRKIWRFLRWPIYFCLGAVLLIFLFETWFAVQYMTINPHCREASARYICEFAEACGRNDCFSLPRYINPYRRHPNASYINHYRNPENASPEYRICMEDKLRRQGACIIPLPISEFLERVYARIKGKRFYELDEECPGWHERPIFA